MKTVIFKLQGGYYTITGLWPVVHMSSFLTVTGPKTDLWLVEMVGLLSASIGVFLFAHSKKHPYILGILAAVSYLSIDCIYVFKDVISPIYLSDALTQVVILIWYLVTQKKRDKLETQDSR